MPDKYRDHEELRHYSDGDSIAVIPCEGPNCRFPGCGFASPAPELTAFLYERYPQLAEASRRRAAETTCICEGQGPCWCPRGLAEIAR